MANYATFWGTKPMATCRQCARLKAIAKAQQETILKRFHRPNGNASECSIIVPDECSFDETGEQTDTPGFARLWADDVGNASWSTGWRTLEDAEHNAKGLPSVGRYGDDDDETETPTERP